MSLYVRWLNEIKSKANINWLTDSQKTVINQISNNWLSSSFICLYGPPGSGKTFIARILSLKPNYIYIDNTQDLEKVNGSDLTVILDDGRDYNRLLRATATRLGVNRIIFVSQRIPKDVMPIAKLMLTPRDVRQFQSNLNKAGIITSFLSDYEGLNLNELLRSEVIIRGAGK